MCRTHKCLHQEAIRDDRCRERQRPGRRQEASTSRQEARFSLGWCCHTSALFKTSLHELGVQFRLEVIGRAKGCEKLIDARRIARKDL